MMKMSSLNAVVTAALLPLQSVARGLLQAPVNRACTRDPVVDDSFVQFVKDLRAGGYTGPIFGSGRSSSTPRSRFCGIFQSSL
ncbi:MAG: hypothetical protein AB7G06_05440 [Bdellovibrionales bacterium]